MGTDSNHHQLFLDASGKQGAKPERKMQISQSFPCRSTETQAGEKSLNESKVHRKCLALPKSQLPCREEEYHTWGKRPDFMFFFFLTATFPWCLWSNLQKFDVCRFCQHISPECNYREACILNGRQSHSDWSSTQTSWFNNSINDFKRRSKDYSAPLSVAMCYLWDSISIMSSPYYFLLSGPKLFGLPN